MNTDNMSDKRKFIAKTTDSGIRLDRYLANEMPEFSRSEIQHFSVLQNDRPVRFSLKVKPGDTFIVEIPVKKPMVASQNISNNFDLQILYEDDDIIVINKPRGVVMYPSAGNKTGTLVQNILSHTHLSALGGPVRPGVVHRLDKDTSGVMVFAKSDRAYHGLVKLFSNHDLVRKYTAFVWGTPNWEAADITGNITRSSRNRQKMTMVNRGGKPAHTEVFVIKTWDKPGISMLLCNLFTGRTHQIRVHLSAHGFPILCDSLYGRGTNRLGTVKNSELLNFLKNHRGQMLHAGILEFIHPITNRKMKFKSPLPDDMQRLKTVLDNIK